MEKRRTLLIINGILKGSKPLTRTLELQTPHFLYLCVYVLVCVHAHIHNYI